MWTAQAPVSMRAEEYESNDESAGKQRQKGSEGHKRATH